MEAIPRLPMLSFELKTSPEYVDFGPVLKQYIRDQYGEDPAHYNKACSDLEQLRQNAVHVSHDFMGCSTLKKYYAQLQFLQGRFPMMEGGQATMPFTWDDIFMTREITLADIKFEQASVLYNIGSLHSILGAMETRHSADGMKVACTHFQCAAWAYEYLRDHFGSALMSNDFSHELLTFHVNLMLAQAQECILEKSMIDSRKSTITAKVAIQIVEFCNAATKALDVSHSDGIISSRRHKDWKKRIEIKVLLYQSISNFYMGKQSEEQQKWGECLAYFELSNKKLQECIKLSKSESSDIQESLRFANDVIGGKFQSAKKDNDFVYHDKVPDPSSLPEVKGASLVKGIPFNPNDPEISGPDLFQKLVPMEAHEASSLYSEEKAKLSRQVCGEIEDKDTQLSQFMSSLNLDESRLNFEPEKLPQELLEKCAAVSVKPNAIKNLIESMTAVSNLATEVEMSLREVSDFLENESTQEEEFQKQFGKRDINPMFETIRKELGLFEEGHRKGSQSNSDLHKAMNAHITNLRLLGGPIEDIKNALPSIEKERNTEDEGIAKEVKRLVSKVKEMQDQRSMLQEQFRKQIHEDDITNVLVTQEGANKQVMFDNELKKHEKTINLIQQNLGAQEKILNALTSTNARYATVRQSTDNVSERRDAMIKDLINSYEVYEDLLAKSQRGQEFYRKLEGNVKRLLARCQGLCKIQAEEREQILARFKPKVPVPSRPTAPKPQAPQAPRSPQPAGEPPENMSQTPPEQSYQSPVAPQFPTISSFDGPKLKDYLPFMKPKTFGKDRKTSSTTGSLPGSSAGSPVHLPAGSESLPGSPLQSLRRADTGDLDPSRLTGSLPGSPLHRRRMGDMGQYEISGPENYSFPDVTRQGMRSGGHRVGPRQEAYGGPITGNDFPSSGAAMLHSLPPQNHPTSVSGTSGESKAFVSQPQHFNPNISSQDNSPQIQPNLNLAYSGAGMGGYQPHPNMPPYSNSAGPTGHPEDSRTQAPSPALPLDSSQQQLKRPPQNMDPRQSGYNTEKFSHLTPKGHQDYSVSYHGDPISHSGPAIMSNIASVSQEQNSISTVSTVHAPMTSRVNSNTYSVLPQNIQQPSVQHKQPAPFPSQHSGISQTQLPSNLYQQQFSHTSQQLPSNPQQLSTNQYGMSNIPQQNPGSSQAQLPSNAQQLQVSSQQFPQSSQPFHYGSQFPNSSQNISSVHGSSSQTGQQYPQNSLDQQSTDQSGKCAVASHGPTYTTTTSYSGSTQTQGQYHQISQGQIPQQPVGQSQQPPQQSLPPRQPPQQSMPPQQLPQQSVPHQFPQQSLPGQQHPPQSLPGQQPHQQSLPGQQPHQQSLPPQQPINTGQQYTYGTPGGSQTGLPVSGQSQVYGISQQPGQMLPGQNWTAGQVGHQVSTSNIHQHPSQQLNSPAAQLQQQGQQVKGQMMTQQYISSQSNTNPASSAYSYVQSNTSQQQGLISATGQPSVSMTTGSGQLRQPAPQTFQQYPSQQPGMYGQQQQQWQQQPGLQQQQLRFQTPQQQQVPSQQQQQQVPRHQQLQQQMQQPLPQQQKIPTQQHQLPPQQQQITPQQQQLPSQQQQLPSQQQQLPKNQQQWFQQQQQQLSYQQQQILQQQQMPQQQQLSQQQFQPQHQLSKQQQLQQQVPTSQQQVSQQKQQFPTHQSPQQQPLPTQQQQPLPTQQQPLPTQQQPLPKQQQPLSTQQQPLPTQQQQPLPTQQQPLPTQQQSLPIQQQPLSTQQHTLPTQQQQSLPTKQHQPLPTQQQMPTQQQFASHVPQQNMQPMLPQSQQWTQPPQQAPPSQQWAKQPQQAPQPQQWAQQPPVSLQQQQWNRPTQYQEKLPLSPDSATQNLLPSPMTPTVAERPLSPLDKSQILPSDPIGQNISELSSLTDLKPSPKHVKSDISNTSVTERKMHSRQHSTSSTTSFDDILSSSPGVPQESTKEGMLTPKVLTAQEIQQQKEEAMLKSSFTRQSSKDPYSDPLVKDRFVGEVEKFAKCVESLTKITCSGFSNLDLYWKELIEEQEKGGKKTSMAIARCYPAKNRDQDIMPYDNTRVKLVSSKDDYINASWITELSPSCPKFISTQLPLAGTIVDFWTMVYEQGSEVIVMLTSDTETGKKYPEYWPNQKGQMEEYGAISLILQSVKDKTNWTERIFHLNHREKKQGRTIVQLQYKNWPISGFPENISYLLQFINEVHSFYRQQRSLLKPVIIHCSNGIGRTGVFMLTYTGMQEIDHGNGIINIPEVAKKMFQQRRFAVKEKGQLKYVYDAILYYSQDILAKQGILVRKASFGDPLPHPGERSNQWTPKEDVLFGTQLSISALQARLGQNEPQIIMKSGGSESDISVSDKEIDSRNSVERTLSENLPDVVQRTDLQQNKVKEDSVGSSQQEEITDKNRTETSSSGVLIEDIPTSNIIEKEITKQDGSLQFTTDNSTVCEQTPPVSTTKMSLSDLQNPQTFTLGTCDKSKKKITKDSFHQQNLTLTENLNDPADPLSTLDPLWSINK